MQELLKTSEAIRLRILHMYAFSHIRGCTRGEFVYVYIYILYIYMCVCVGVCLCGCVCVICTCGRCISVHMCANTLLQYHTLSYTINMDCLNVGHMPYKIYDLFHWFSINGGTPNIDGFLMENPIYKWMIWG